jgi:nicotinamide-nucleotide amidase
LVAAFGAGVYSTDGRTVEAVVADALRGRGATLAVAESCTGGLLGGRLTAAAGSSEWFRGGVIAYDDAVKRDLLGVPAEVLARYGAVSAECARAMAEGARRAAGAEWALSVTGIAGPGGGTPEKPVGLVFIGVAGPGVLEAHEHRFRGDRERVRERSVAAALHHLRLALAADVAGARAMSRATPMSRAKPATG